MSPEFEEALLRKAGYRESAVRIYKDLKAMPFRTLDGRNLAEEFLRILDRQKGSPDVKAESH